MECPKCRHENPEDSAFCGKCATRLGQEVPPAFTKTLETSQEELTSGTTLSGRYRIIEELGQGGMGKVYRGEDTSLSRPVAIKVLPEEFAGDPERLARFEREAKLLAALNHPNIASIHGIEESDGRRFLVLELADGETLRARLDRGPLPVDEALETCQQIAEGLEAAHEKGIIHRDLKPGNVMISAEGKVKILDFGLAKAYSGETSVIDLEKSPTITAQMTKPGVIMGTAAYMSPEQARSRAVDKKTDVWSFGCVLYECLTGKRAFEGETISDTMALILKGEPDWTALPENISPNVRSLLGRCLQKARRNRLHDIADARIEIEDTIKGTLGIGSGPFRDVLPRRLWSRFVPVVLIAIIFGFIAGAFLYKNFLAGARSNAAQPFVSFLKIDPGERLTGGAIAAEEGLANSRPSRLALAISPDGKNLVYAAVVDNESQLFLHQWNQVQALPIPGTEGGHGPFFSPDSQWLAFWQGPKMKKMRLEEGLPVTILEERPGGQEYGASWGPNDLIVFSAGDTIWQIGAAGGTPRQLTQLDEKTKEISHRHPFLLPGGEAICFTVFYKYDRINDAKVVAQNMRTGERKDLLEEAADVRYLPTGHLIFIRQGNLMAVSFDARRLEIIGQPRTVINDVMQPVMGSNSSVTTGVGQYSCSDNGSLAFVMGGVGSYDERELMWVDRSGTEERIRAFDHGAAYPRISSDGTKVVFRGTWSNKPGEGACIYVYDISRDDLVKRTPEGDYSSPLWDPSGTDISYSEQEKNIGFYHFPWDGSKAAEKFLDSGGTPSSWSPDGVHLAYSESSSSGNRDVWIYNRTTGLKEPFINSDLNESDPVFSPDGRWLAYTSDLGGQTNVYVYSFPERLGPFKISTDGGSGPAWALDGREIFYCRGTGPTWDMCAVRVATSPKFIVSNPVVLLNFPRSRVSITSPVRNYDISPRDGRFLMIGRGPQQNEAVTEFVLIQNWFEELKRLVPTGKK